MRGRQVSLPRWLVTEGNGGMRAGTIEADKMITSHVGEAFTLEMLPDRGKAVDGTERNG